MPSQFYRVDNLLCKIEPSISFEEIVFSFGGGFDVVQPVGHPDGVRKYTLSSQALTQATAMAVGLTTDTMGEPVFETPLGGLTRARYLWELFKLTKRDPDIGIVLKCPIEERDVSVRFASNTLSLNYVAAYLWSTGVEFVQTRNGNLVADGMVASNPVFL